MASDRCPAICPHNQKKIYFEAGQHAQIKARENEPKPYVPGLIVPPEPKVYPADAPPRYLPQPTDTTNGDILVVGPVGPWSGGHIDWSPDHGSTGVRPVVEKYSITRYSTRAWRNNNEKVLSASPVVQGDTFQVNTRKAFDEAFAIIDRAKNHSNDMLKKRVEDMRACMRRVRQEVANITNEIETLDGHRAKLKGASRILMLPEAISKECLELRTHRLEPDLVRDDAEQELIKEVSIVSQIRSIINTTLNKVETQMAENRAAKAILEGVWSDKLVTLRIDKFNMSLSPDSTLILDHKGVNRWPENQCTLEYWKHFCDESIRNCADVRNKSERLRDDLMTAIIKGAQDLKIQGDRTNSALKETIDATEQLIAKLEETLRDTLQKIADQELFIQYIKEQLREAINKTKLCMSRLRSRNYDRPNVENCRDEAQYALMKEYSLVREASENLKDKLREADAIRSSLMKFRGDLELQIASKRKAILIDKDRFSRVRAFFPSPEEFAGENLS